MESISPHISYSEATLSDTAKRLGIPNIPNEEHLARMRILAERVFEPLRQHFGVPIYISSFFRSSALNASVGGSTSSQHVLGEAMDLDAEKFGGITNKEIFEFIKNNLEFNQLIWEGGTSDEPDWIHVSYTNRYPNRKQILVIKK